MNACFCGAELTGTVFRDTRLDQADFTGARCYRSQWLGCHLEGVTGLPRTAPQALYALVPVRHDVQYPPRRRDVRLAALDGHCGSINACAFAPDGRRLASASEDGTLRLWDVTTGRETGWRIHHFRDGAWALLDLADNRIVRLPVTLGADLPGWAAIPTAGALSATRPKRWVRRPRQSPLNRRAGASFIPRGILDGFRRLRKSRRILPAWVDNLWAFSPNHSKRAAFFQPLDSLGASTRALGEKAKRGCPYRTLPWNRCLKGSSLNVLIGAFSLFKLP